MSRKLVCFADGRVEWGDRVLVRQRRVSVAGPATANATALKPGWWVGRNWAEQGESVLVMLDEAMGSRNLHALANGPIMDPSMIYLPAGKLSMAETRERERLQVLSTPSTSGEGKRG